MAIIAGPLYFHATPNTQRIDTVMSRIVSINQSEPGLYLVNVQRSRSASIGTVLRAIANPPLEETRVLPLNGSDGARENGSTAAPVAAHDGAKHRGARR